MKVTYPEFLLESCKAISEDIDFLRLLLLFTEVLGVYLKEYQRVAQVKGG